jgi:hypothetical protein
MDAVAGRRVAVFPNLDVATLAAAGQLPFADHGRLHAALGGNSGNIAYVEGLLASIGPAWVAGWSTPPERVRERADIVLVCCANQLGDHVDLAEWGERLRAIDLPVLLVGIGAQAPRRGAPLTLRPGTRAMLEWVAARAGDLPAILTRGKYTRTVLAAHGIRSEVLGCPSLFLSPETGIGARLEARVAAGLGERAAIAAGNPYDFAHYRLEAPLIALGAAHGGYVVQHPAEMIALARHDGDTLADTFFASIAPRFWPDLDRAGVVAWGRRHMQLFTDTQQWMSFLRRYDYCIGPRYHGVALAIQAGVPAAVLAIDSRTEELAETMATPFAPMTALATRSPQAIVAAGWGPGTGARFDARRTTLARRFASILRSHRVAPSARLAALGGAQSAGS